MSTTTLPGDELTAAIPGGEDRPPDIPPEIFEAALRTVLDCRRLDMRALAGELGMSRSTLYRRVRGRDELLGQVLWYLSRRSLARGLRAASELRGQDRVLAVTRQYLRDVEGRPALRRLLQAEPEAALRVLTSADGVVQPGIVEVLDRVLAEEEARGELPPNPQRRVLAYAIVRVGESFLYADVIANHERNLDYAFAVIARLLASPNPQVADVA